MYSNDTEVECFRVICSYCSTVLNKRNIPINVTGSDEGSKIVSTHGICRDCMKKYFPLYYDRLKEKEVISSKV